MVKCETIQEVPVTNISNIHPTPTHSLINEPARQNQAVSHMAYNLTVVYT